MQKSSTEAQVFAYFFPDQNIKQEQLDKVGSLNYSNLALLPQGNPQGSRLKRIKQMEKLATLWVHQAHSKKG